MMKNLLIMFILVAISKALCASDMVFSEVVEISPDKAEEFGVDIKGKEKFGVVYIGLSMFKNGYCVDPKVSLIIFGEAPVSIANVPVYGESRGKKIDFSFSLAAPYLELAQVYLDCLLGRGEHRHIIRLHDFSGKITILD